MSQKYPTSSREMERFARDNELEQRRSGNNHVVTKLPNGNSLVTTDHGEWGPATRCAVKKTLVMAGFILVMAAVWILFCM